MDAILNIIYLPLAMILKLCYFVTQNYGLAIILFALLSKVLMLPLSIKSERGRLKMTKIQPKIAVIQQKYKGNTKDPKYAEEVNALYKDEGYSQMAGCLPMLIQFPLIMGLWNAIKNPLTYVCGLAAPALCAIYNAFVGAGFDMNMVGAPWNKADQIALSRMIDENMDLVGNLLPEGFKNIDLNFLGLNLGDKPVMGLHITVLIPIISALTSFLIGFISNKINNPSGKRDPSQPNMNFILYFMPLLSLWMGFSFQIGVGIYWISSNIFALLQTILLPKFIKEPVKEVKVKEKKVNYNQIEKMEREKKKLELEKTEYTVENTEIPADNTEDKPDKSAKGKVKNSGGKKKTDDTTGKS